MKEQSTGEYDLLKHNVDYLLETADKNIECIYRTQKPQIGRSVYKVEDANITKERWLLKPTCFILIGKISGQIVEFIDKNQTNFHGDIEQMRGLFRIRKFLKEHRREILLDSYYGKFI